MSKSILMRIAVASVKMTCDALTDLELAALNLVAQTDQDPRDRVFDYQQVKGLFTESGGTRMHEMTKMALAKIVNERLNVTR